MDAREHVARGVALFNDGLFFEAHEVWEDLWRETPDDPSRTRTLLQGLIQVAAAFHKLHVQRDPVSAARILTRARAKIALALEATPASASPIGLRDLDAFLRALDAAQSTLESAGRWPRAPHLQ